MLCGEILKFTRRVFKTRRKFKAEQAASRYARQSKAKQASSFNALKF